MKRLLLFQTILIAVCLSAYAHKNHVHEKPVEKNTMPPTRYKVMHWNSGINPTEAAKIYEWIDMSLKILEKKN